ncbi:hypothetical protein BDV25DRAFT_148955 [Aspergillus avenaceus]|uniref:Uncharacterized protein n=1 Tax=Aspergillus avenaceus TaxID=36643 RepID=A0A5N6U5K2_ASPAV|nr:hypothetical protein BDV25DRAFT_148955 [Aspergillus avenaceus]
MIPSDHSRATMWYLAIIETDSQLWCSDGKPVNTPRGGTGVSSRFIVDGQGFLDLTQIAGNAIDANGLTLFTGIQSHDQHTADWRLFLQLPGDGAFVLGVYPPGDGCPNTTDRDTAEDLITVSGTLKPLPAVSPTDALFLEDMITEGIVPYPDNPDSPVKSADEIRELGKRLFPFTPFSFPLAMCVYDWTTVSFARLVFLKIFEYTGTGPPYPLDRQSVAQAIWGCDWEIYTPKNRDFMRTFLMNPASSLADVEAQLAKVIDELHFFSDAQNRLLAAAMRALPRTCTITHPQLYSGQVDIQHLGLNHFGIEFLECPLNHAVGESLQQNFHEAMASYIAPGRVITTKMVWSFADSLRDAVEYSNGILLVLVPPGGKWTWESGAYITPLSVDPRKTEYTFLAGTRFEVRDAQEAYIYRKRVVVITLLPCPPVDLG